MKSAASQPVWKSRRQSVIMSTTVLCLLHLAFAPMRANAQIALPGQGLINTIAGNGSAGYSGDNGAAVNAELQHPGGVAVDSNGNVYVADYYNSRIRKIAASTGIITTVAGNGTAGYSGDGGTATSAKLNYPTAVAVDGSGNIYIVDGSNLVIRKVTTSGVITTVAGNGDCCYSGDGGAATKAEMEPLGVAVDSSGNIYISDFGNRIRKVTASTGIITTVAGNGTAGYSGDGGAATSAKLNYPNGVALDSSGNIYIADTSNERIRKVTVSTGIITTVAGNGTLGYSGDGGAATSAELGYPWDVAIDSSGNIYIGDSNNNRVRQVAASTGIISTIAGNGVQGYVGDGGSAMSAELNGPQGVAVDSSGNTYVADSGNSRIRAIGAGSAPSPPAMPTFSPAAGTYLSAQTVAISDTTSGVTIYYTTDGTTPTTSSTRYTGPISVSSSETINAIAVTGSVSSAVATAAYTVGSAPTFSPVGGTYTSAQTVSITTTDFGATIYYTTNGTTPTTSSTQYTGPISVSSTETIEAIAVVGAASSTVSTATYTINIAPVYTTATITVGGGEQPGDSNTIAVSFNGFQETVNYGAFSTPAAIASAFGAKFSNDYLQVGLCAHASGTTITFKLKGGAAFGSLAVGGSANSFQLTSSGFASESSPSIYDMGTVTLTVGGVVAAQTNYSNGATPSSVAEGLAASVTSDSLVNVTAVDNTLSLQSKQVGAATNYNYTLQTSNWDSADFAQPSFAYPAISSSLSGGVDASSGSGGQGPQTIYSYSIPSYVVGQQPTGYDGVGNVVGYTDSVMGGWGFSYDPLRRLTSGSATTGSYAGLQAGWSYDAFGNRTGEVLSGTTQMPMPTSSTASYNANNQINGSSLMLGAAVQYDAAGDITEDNQNQYLYDGEGRLCAVKNMTVGTMTGYVYGADGTRVSTGTITRWGSCDPSANGYQATKDSIPGPNGRQLTETGVNANGTVAWAHTNVWVGDDLLATYDANGIHFYLNDWVGSRRVQTNYEGNIEQTCANLPYGDGEICTPTPSEFLYGSLERDAESGLDHAAYRQYSSTFGMWITPDPYSGSYDWTNPQSLNRYAYVNGKPMRMSDPGGLLGCQTSDAVYDTNGNFLGGNVGAYAANCISDYVISTTVAIAPQTTLMSVLASFIPYVQVAIEAYDIFKAFKGSAPKFKGNTQASRQGKNVQNAPNNSNSTSSVTPQQEQACENAWNNSATGKGVQFFSLYNLATNLSSLKTLAEWTVLPAAKIAALGALSNASSAIGGTELSSVITGTTTTVTAAPVASGIAVTESAGAVAAPATIVGATVVDMDVNAACEGVLIPAPGVYTF